MPCVPASTHTRSELSVEREKGRKRKQHGKQTRMDATDTQGKLASQLRSRAQGLQLRSRAQGYWPRATIHSTLADVTRDTCPRP